MKRKVDRREKEKKTKKRSDWVGDSISRQK